MPCEGGGRGGVRREKVARRRHWDAHTAPPPPPTPLQGPTPGKVEEARRGRSSDEVFSRQLRLSSFDWAGSACDHLGTNRGAPQWSAVIGSSLFCDSHTAR